MPRVSTRGGMSNRGFGFGAGAAGPAPIPFNSQSYTSAGTYSFVVPTGGTEISAVCVGAGGGSGGGDFDNVAARHNNGGGGGALSYQNSIPVTPGETLTVVVGLGGFMGNPGDDGYSPVAPTDGSPSYIARGGTVLLQAAGGGLGQCLPLPTVIATGGQSSAGTGAVRYSGGNGGGPPASIYGQSSSGGAAGYSGNGGQGGYFNSIPRGGPFNGSNGSGGGGGGGAGYYGAPTANNYTGQSTGAGGVGILGEGSSGTGGIWGTSAVNWGTIATSGSGGINPVANNTSPAPYLSTGFGGGYGGGGGTANFNRTTGVNNTSGAVRIIWGGTGKSYPSNAT